MNSPCVPIRSASVTSNPLYPPRALGSRRRSRWPGGAGRSVRSGSIRTDGVLLVRAGGGDREPVGGVAGDLEAGLAVGDADRADLAAW